MSRMSVLAFSLPLLSLPLLGAASCEGARGDAKAGQKYFCPMHPGFVSDKPGDCPVCSMKLVPMNAAGAEPVRAQTAPPAASGPKGQKGEHKPLFYRNPMDPSVTSPVPKKDSMGMDYLPVYPEDVAGSASSLPGTATVTIDPERRRLIGLKTIAVRRADLAATLRTVGRVAMDETRVVKVQPRFEGFIEKLEADSTGKLVKKGQRLVSIYSPELLATEEELLLAARGRAALAASGLPGAEDAARARLRLAGIGDGQIDEIVRAGKPLRTLDLVAPLSGYVTAKNAVLGGRVDMTQPLFEIADLSSVWVLADVYESDLPRVAVGQRATITLAYWPGRSWRGRVSYLLPTVDDKTRTVKVRIEVQNPKTELRPEMFAEVVLQGTPRRALVAPEDALIDTGTRKVAFVAIGEGRLQPREVQVGMASDGLVEVRSGLVEGEEVATGASFLLDSESRLKAALSSMASMAKMAAPTPKDAGARP